MAVAAIAPVGVGCHVLVQASGHLDEETGQQVAIGLDVAQFGEHPFDGGASIIVFPPDVVSHTLDFVADSICEFAIETPELVGNFAELFLERIHLFPKDPSQFLVGVGALFLFMPDLAGD